jgi:hypothetical protein
LDWELRRGNWRQKTDSEVSWVAEDHSELDVLLRSFLVVVAVAGSWNLLVVAYSAAAVRLMSVESGCRCSTY